MNKLFQRIQFFVECRDAESIEPMGNLVKIVSHTRNCTDELHFFRLDSALYFCICNYWCPIKLLGVYLC